MKKARKDLNTIGRKNQRGFTLFQTLLFLVILMLLSVPLMRIVANQRNRSVNTHWARCAEALADGALVMAVHRVSSVTGETELALQMPTGLAKAVIAPGTQTGHVIARIEGIAGSDLRIRAVRVYEARLSRASGEEEWKVASITRLPPEEELLPKRFPKF